MLYYFVKYLCQLGFRVNFKKVFLHYQEALPKDKTLLFAVNHPTAFIDPVMLATYLERPTNFIVRGDIFKGKIILKILNGLHLIPIFRFRDGFSNLKNNQATMETIYQKLADNECLLILAEGDTKHEKRLRPIQKGLARMAFGTVEAHGNTDIVIVPVGVNYTDSHQFRSFIMTEVGKPFPLSDYQEIYNENPRKAIKQVTDKVAKEMQKLVIHIEKEEDDPWVNRILEIQRNDFKYSLFPILSSDSTLWEKEYKAVVKMNACSEDEKNNSKTDLKNYDEKLQKLNVTDRGVARPEHFSFLNSLFLFFGFTPFLFGSIFSLPPMKFASNLAKNKVKKIEFHSSVRFGAGLVGSLIYILILLLVSLFVGHPLVIGLVLAIPVFGYFALIYMEVFEKWNAARKFRGLTDEEQEDLRKCRESFVCNVY